jgi:hypothetical protein
MKKRRALSLTIVLLLLFLLPLALAACGDGGNEEQGQADKQEQRGEEEKRRREKSPGQGEEPVEELSEEQQAAKEMAEIHQQFRGQVEVFPGAMPDTSAAATQAREDSGGDWVLFTPENPQAVARFYESSLRRMRDLEKEDTPSGVVFTFTDDRGGSARVEVVQAGSAQQDGTYIIMAAG